MTNKEIKEKIDTELKNREKDYVTFIRFDEKV